MEPVGCLLCQIWDQLALGPVGYLTNQWVIRPVPYCLITPDCNLKQRGCGTYGLKDQWAPGPVGYGEVKHETLMFTAVNLNKFVV